MADLKLIIYDIVMIFYVLVAVSIFLPWILLSLDPASGMFIAISSDIFWFFSYFCHQLPERSLFLNNIQMPVCARCATIYIATAVGLVFFRLKGYGKKEFRMNWPLFVLLFLPVALDGFTQLFGWRESTNLLRLATGIPYGLGYAYGIAWALPFIYALLELIGACLKKDVPRVKTTIKRLIGMAWPISWLPMFVNRLLENKP